jgi:hypothetical protein
MRPPVAFGLIAFTVSRDAAAHYFDKRPKAESAYVQKFLTGVTPEQNDQLDESQRKQQVRNAQCRLQPKVPPQFCELPQSIDEVEDYK